MTQQEIQAAFPNAVTAVAFHEIAFAINDRLLPAMRRSSEAYGMEATLSAMQEMAVAVGKRKKGPWDMAEVSRQIQTPDFRRYLAGKIGAM